VIAMDDQAVLVRGMDVTARVTNSVDTIVSTGKDGILLETLIGRYVLDSDAREPWLLIDGIHSIAEIAAAVALSRATAVDDILPAVRDFCAQLLNLRLVKVVPVGGEARGVEHSLIP
jgi:hypothetical protein